MSNLAEYFEKIRHKPTYHLGDRVGGEWNGIPWIGTVGAERTLYPDKPPVMTVFVDLPIFYEGKYHRIISVDPSTVKRRTRRT